MTATWRVLAIGLPIGMVCLGQGSAKAQAASDVESAQSTIQRSRL